MSKERIRPMPTAEQKARAKKEMASADPFALARKSVDDEFPDSREKSQKTLREDAEVEKIVRKIMAMERTKARTAVKKEAPVQKPAGKTPVKAELHEPKKVESETTEAEAPNLKAEELEVEKPEAEKTEVIKAIEDAFEGDDAVTDDNFDDFDDIEQMEKSLYEEEAEDDEAADEDIMKTEMLNGDSLKDELEKADFSSDDSDIMDDFDDDSDEKSDEEVAEEAVADEANDEAASDDTDDVNDRPVNMVLGKKAEESEGLTETTEDGKMTVDVTPMTQDMKDKIRAKQMNFEAEGSTKNPLIDDGKPVPEIKKVDPLATPKTKVKMMGAELKQKKMMVAMIALALVAFGGVLFGVVAMINQGRSSEELAQQMAAMISNNSSSASNTVEDDYINVKDWGLKIKIVEGLTDVSYNVANDEMSEVMIWGAKRDNTVSYTPDFARQSKNSNPLGTVVRVARYERSAAGRLIWYDDYYNYYYQGPTGIPSVSESEMNWWVESYLLIKEMLTNADNYTTIEETNTIGQQQ